jgi:2-keto-4-pentenoate hydratase
LEACGRDSRKPFSGFYISKEFILDKTLTGKLAEDLFRAQTDGRQRENPGVSYPSLTTEEAYEIQDAMVEIYKKNRFTPAGYKVGCTLCAKWKELGATEPFYGQMFRERIFENAAELRSSGFLEPRLETEIVFVLKKDLYGSGTDAGSVIEATAYVAAAVEIVDSRTVAANKTMRDIIADNGSFGACLPQTAGKKSLESFDINSETVKITVNGAYRETGAFIEVMNSPVNSIVWLARKLAEKKRPLKAGAVILSGSSIAPFAVKPGDVVGLAYSSFGNVAVKIV